MMAFMLLPYYIHQLCRGSASDQNEDLLDKNSALKNSVEKFLYKRTTIEKDWARTFFSSRVIENKKIALKEMVTLIREGADPAEFKSPPNPRYILGFCELKAIQERYKNRSHNTKILKITRIIKACKPFVKKKVYCGRNLKENKFQEISQVLKNEGFKIKHPKTFS